MRQRRGDPPLRHRQPQGTDTFISAFLVTHRRGGPGCRGPPGEGEPLSGRSGTERRAGTGAMCRQRSHRPAARSGLRLRGGMAQPSQDHGGPHRSASAQSPGQGGDGEADTGLPEQRRAGRATARQPLIQQLHPPRGHPHPTHNPNPLPPTLGSALPGRHRCQGPARAARKSFLKAKGPTLSKASRSQPERSPPRHPHPTPRFPFHQPRGTLPGNCFGSRILT